MRAIGRHRIGITLPAMLVTAVAVLGPIPAPTVADANDDLNRPHVLDGDVAEILVRVHGSSACSGTPLVETALIITAAHCVLDHAGEVTPVTVVRDGVEYTPQAVLVNTRYHETQSTLLDAAVLVMRHVVPGPAARLGDTLPTQGLVTLAGFQPIDTDGSLLRGTRYGQRPIPKGVTGGVVHIESLPSGCVERASAIEVADDQLKISCGLIPGASGGGLFAEQGGELVLLGVTSTVGRDLSYNGLTPLAAVHALLVHPGDFTHVLAVERSYAPRPTLTRQ
jgi:hypothetical protein